MTCSEIHVRAPLYLSGEMTFAGRKAFAAHLAACASCKGEIEAQMQIDARLAAALGREYPDSRPLARRVESGIARERRRRRWRALAAAAGTALAACVVGIQFLHSPPAPAWFADAALDQRAETAQKQLGAWRTAPAEIEAIAAASGFSYARAIALAPPTYTLDRAKRCAIDGQAMLHLVFGNGANEYSVYVGTQPGRRAPVRIARVHNEEVAGFETGHFRVIVVTDGPPSECAAFAQITAARL